MEIRFCDICNESVPQSDLDQGKAYIRKGRVVCATCEVSMSHPDSTWDEPSGTATEPLAARAGETVPEYAREPLAGGGVFAPPMAIPPGRPRISVGVILASLLAFAALAVTCLMTFVLAERVQDVRGTSMEQVARVEDDLVGEVSRLESVLERWREEDRSLVQEELERTKAEADRVRARHDESMATLRRDVEALRALTIRLDAIEQSATVRSGEVRTLGSDLAQVKRDVGVLAERWLEATAGMTSTTELLAEPEPVWMEHTRGLQSPNAASRWTAVTELGATKDAAVVSYLIAMLEDPDIFVRMATARVLGDIGSEEAIPGLVDALEDEELPVREAANLALCTITGQDLRFEPNAPPAERERRVKAWRDWWKKQSKA